MWPLLLLACRMSGPAPAPAPVDPATRWTNGPAGIVLEVATDRYRRPEGPGEVVVVGSVHVADPAFYGASVATLRSAGEVFYEGLIDDVGTDGAVAETLASQLGLAAQGDVAPDPGWHHADLRQSELRRRMADAGVSEAAIVDLLGDPEAPPSPPDPMPTGPTGPALAKLALIKGLAKPPNDDGDYQRWLIAERNAHAVALLPAPGDDAALWFGADHLPDLGRRLQEAGYEPPVRTWVPAMVAGYSELQLGPAQAEMLMTMGKGD